MGLRSRLRRLAALLVTGLWALACDSTDPISTPTTPSVEPKTDTFNGRLTAGGAVTFPFVVAAAGPVTATLSSVTPGTAPPIGMGLGTWDAENAACRLIVTNDSARQGAVISTATLNATNLCVRISDAGSAVLADVSFTLQVVHP